MAYVDAFITLANAQAVTTTGATTNIIDLYSELGDAIEPGMWVRVGVQTTMDFPSTNNTMQFQLQTSDDSGGLTGVTLASTAALAEGVWVAGYEAMKIKLPIHTRRYLRGYFVCTGTATAGNIDVHLLKNVDSLITDVEGIA